MVNYQRWGSCFLEMFFHFLAAFISCTSLLFSIVLAALQPAPHLFITKLPETEWTTPGVVSSESWSGEVMLLFIMVPCSHLAPNKQNPLLMKSMCPAHTHTPAFTFKSWAKVGYPLLQKTENCQPGAPMFFQEIHLIAQCVSNKT